MEDSDQRIPETTLEALARNFFKETSAYGFKQVDYVRFVNYILDRAMGRQDGVGIKEKKPPAELKKTKKGVIKSSQPPQLPLIGKNVRIRAFHREQDKSLLEKWVVDEYGRYFLLSLTTAKAINLEQLIENDFHIIGIITLHDETPIGAMAYLNYDVMQFKAELRKLIGEPDMRGRGYGKEATHLWIGYGTETLDLKKIYLNIILTGWIKLRKKKSIGIFVFAINALMN